METLGPLTDIDKMVRRAGLIFYMIALYQKRVRDRTTMRANHTLNDPDTINEYHENGVSFAPLQPLVPMNFADGDSIHGELFPLVPSWHC